MLLSNWLASLRTRTRHHSSPVFSSEVLESRVLLTTFDATIVHDAVACREVDSVKIGISPNVPGDTSSVILVATPPGHGPPIDVPDQSNFAGCNFDSDPTGGPGETLLGEVILQNGDIAQFFRDDAFWQPGIDLVEAEGQSFTNVTRFALSREDQFGEFNQYATGTSDGYVRQISLPQENLIDLKFNSSAVLGNTVLDTTLPSGEERYRANIGTLAINFNGGWQANHRAGGQSHISVLEVSPKRTVLRADFSGFTTEFPVVMTSMNSTVADNTSDMNVVLTRDVTGNVQFKHVRDVAGTTISDVTGLSTLKTVLTDHNTNGIDLSVYLPDSSLIGSTEIFEVEESSVGLPTMRRDKASSALTQGDTTVWMNPDNAIPAPTTVAVTIPTTVSQTGYYSYGIDYSRESNDSVQSTVSLSANRNVVGSFDATSSRLPTTPAPFGLAWEELKPEFFGTVFHVAGEQVDLLLEVTGQGSDVGIEADVVTRTFVGTTLQPLLIDDGDPGFSTVGMWNTPAIPNGHEGDVHHSPGGNGGKVARWEFTDLTPGNYRVSATWPAHVNRATNSPFSILDGVGGRVLHNIEVNQELSPDDFADAGSDWEDLVVVGVTGDTLVVELSNAANEYVIADAIRLEATDEPAAPPLPFTVIVDDGDAGFATTGNWITPNILRGHEDDLRNSAGGTGEDRATWTFTGLTPGNYRVAATWFAHANRATNAPFTIYDGIGGPVLETIAVNQELAPDDFSDAGSDWETLRIVSITGTELVVELSDAANEYVIADAIRLEATNEPTPPPLPFSAIVDDGDADFSTTGNWITPTILRGHEGDLRHSAQGTGVDRASWMFTGLTPGDYRVSATWFAHANRATNAPFTIFDGVGGPALATIAANQQLVPDDFTDADSDWENLTTVSITGTELVVELSDAADGYVIADAVRIDTATLESLTEREERLYNVVLGLHSYHDTFRQFPVEGGISVQ